MWDDVVDQWDDYGDEEAEEKTVSTFVRVAAEKTGLVLMEYASYALGKARDCVEGLSDSVLGKYVSKAVGQVRSFVESVPFSPLGRFVSRVVIVVEELVVPLWNDLEMFWS